MDVNQSIVSILESIGVGHVFGGSGQVNASMLLALRDSKRIKTVIVRNEQAASFMACGYSMFSDSLGVCFATGGPGAFNLFSGLAVAYSDSLPVLAITGYTSRGQRGKGALNESTGLSRTPDSHAMFSATTKKAYIIEDPEETYDTFADAIRTAFAGRPGPVHIHIPKDVTMAPVTRTREIAIDVAPVRPDPTAVERLAASIAEAVAAKAEILVLIGYGVIRSHGERAALEFVERLQLPFVTTMDAKGSLPEDHPLALGVYGTSGDPSANVAFENARLILAVGNSFAQNATFSFAPEVCAGKTLLHINIDPHEIGKVYAAEHGLVSDARLALVALHEALGRRLPPAAPRRVVKQLWHDTPVENPGSRIHPAEMVKLLSAELPPGAIVLGDAGSHMLWLNCYLHLTGGQRYQNPGSFGPMASHTNAAIGVKCAHPDKVVISGSGDGCYLMSGFELLTAVEYGIPVVWIVFNNGEFNIIKKFLLNVFGDHAYMQFHNPDFVAYARACGALGLRVDRLGEFPGALREAVASGRPALIDVAVDPDVYPPFSLGKV